MNALIVLRNLFYTTSLTDLARQLVRKAEE